MIYPKAEVVGHADLDPDNKADCPGFDVGEWFVEEFIGQHMKASKKYECVLVISDLYIPYHHPQSFDFLKAIKKYKDIDLCVNIGDELDQHGLSEQIRFASGDELTISKRYIKELEKMYPEMVLT